MGKTHKKTKGIDLMREVADRQAREAQQYREDMERRLKKDRRKISA